MPTELKTLLDSRPAMATNPNALASRALSGFPRPAYFDKYGSNVYQVMLGADGKLPVKDWTWEAYASQGRTDAVTLLKSGYASLARYRMLVSAPNYGKNFSLNANNGFIATCTSGIPVFDNFQISQDCIDAMSVPMKNYTDFKQRIAEVNFQGGLFDLPAGEVRSAIRISPIDENTRAVPAGPAARRAVRARSADRSLPRRRYRRFGRREGGVPEFLVPVLKDLPGVKQLNLELGFRYSDYNTAGGPEHLEGARRLEDQQRRQLPRRLSGREPRAEHGGAVHRARHSTSRSSRSEILALRTRSHRGATSRRIRIARRCSSCVRRSSAPNGGSVHDINPNGYVGPFGFFTLEIENLSGNPNLKPEEGKTWTAGLVFRSPFDGALSNLHDVTRLVSHHHLGRDRADQLAHDV